MDVIEGETCVEGGYRQPAGTARPPESAAAAEGATSRDSGRPVQHLKEAGLLAPASLQRATLVARETDEALESVLTKLGIVSEQDMATAFSCSLGLPRVRLADVHPDVAICSTLSIQFLRRFRILPFASEGQRLDVAMANPLDTYASNAISLATRRVVYPYVATPTDIDRALETFSADQSPPAEGGNDGGAKSDDVERLRDLASNAPVIRLVNHIIARAVDARASDVHIEPGLNRLTVRYRIDGMMSDADAPALHLRDAIVSRLKIMAHLDIAERRLPQDGRMSASVRGMEVDFRVSIVPTIYGESAVVRILDRDRISLEFSALGFDEEATTVLRPILELPNGLLLVTGPTGCGKTTTLYAALSSLNRAHRKVMTIEDPVEYRLDGVIQAQVQPEFGFTFADALRSLLRQNPDVIMVGEIRDLETARVAVQSALTGHTILSTLHTNDAATGVTRLLDMGVEDFLLVSTINAIMAQRLVRTLCLNCRQPDKMSPELAERLGLSPRAPADFHIAKGCPDCGGTGFRGRTTILEILSVTDEIRRLTLARASAGQIRRAAQESGMRTMKSHGLQKAALGLTTIGEVLMVTGTDQANSLLGSCREEPPSGQHLI